MRPKSHRLKVVLCWHMHQPSYYDSSSDHYRLPWVYLHAIKDYIDMAVLLEEVPEARAVVNFAPVLIEQINDYEQQVKRYLKSGEPVRDSLLSWLTQDRVPEDCIVRAELIKNCLKANEDTLVNRFEPYKRLLEIGTKCSLLEDRLRYLSDQYFIDLLIWYHLAWMGETVRRGDARIQALMDKSMNFDSEDRKLLITVIGEILSSVLGRYRRLAARGQIELSMTPYAHPMLPLMIDFRASKDALPETPLPERQEYPGGMERLRWHIDAGKTLFERTFGVTPYGCWPSEGGVSNTTMQLLHESGFKWCATGEGVFRNSMLRSGQSMEGHPGGGIYHPYAVDEAGNEEIVCFFRDEGLSDLVGFEYSRWHGEDAVNDFICHLERIAEACPSPEEHVVSIILDGENAWEHYPENGYHFLKGLYEKLSGHPDLEMTTFSECLNTGVKVRNLNDLVAGSWVHGTFSTWMGDPDKNRGWDMLADAKDVCDEVLSSGKINGEKRKGIERQLAFCEGSDWCWWFGDYNPGISVSDFERMYRMHLSNLYRMLGVSPPDYLNMEISQGGGDPARGGVMRTGKKET